MQRESSTGLSITVDSRFLLPKTEEPDDQRGEPSVKTTLRPRREGVHLDRLTDHASWLHTKTWTPQGIG